MDELKRFNSLLTELNGAYHDAAVKLGLSDSAMGVLYALCHYGGSCPLAQIVRFSGISKQTINSALRKLEAEGAVYLKPAGRRKKLVCLTEAGQELANRTVTRLMALENGIFDSWTREECRAYIGLQERYLNQFKERLKELV